MNTETYYTILGVSETATQDEIKKAYRNLAKENHPDKGGDEEVFKKISTAYDVIGDEEKRKQYDIERSNPFAGMGGRFSDLYNDAFNQGRRKHTTNINLEVDVVDTYLSIKKDIEYTRHVSCEPCSGSGGDRTVCVSCGGSGQVIKQFGNGMFTQIVAMPCDGCGGKGFKLTNPCKSCHGTGSKKEKNKIEIKIPHGIDDGQFFRLKDLGDFKNDQYGDLIVRVHLVNNQNFEKFGPNLVYNKFFNLEELQGESFTIPHPDGEIKITLPKNIDTSKPLRIKNKGFKNDGGGDLLVNQFVKFTRD